jgi:hypothetical protein
MLDLAPPLSAWLDHDGPTGAARDHDSLPVLGSLPWPSMCARTGTVAGKRGSASVSHASQSRLARDSKVRLAVARRLDRPRRGSWGAHSCAVGQSSLSRRPRLRWLRPRNTARLPQRFLLMSSCETSRAGVEGFDRSSDCPRTRDEPHEPWRWTQGPWARCGSDPSAFKSKLCRPDRSAMGPPRCRRAHDV